MVDQRPRSRSHHPDIDEYDRNLTEDHVAPYRFGQSARTDSYPEEVPLFLSDYDGEPDPSEYMPALRKNRRTSVSARILAAVLAASAVALLYAAFSSDAARDIIVNAKASINAVLPAPSAAAQPGSSQLTARDIQLKDPTRLSAPANQTAGARSVTTVAAAPTRAEITSAYQSALQNRAPAAAAPTAALPVNAATQVAALPDAALPVARPPVAAAPPAPAAEGTIPRDPIPHLDPNEIAASLTRANSLIASGDLAAARLVLRHPAESGDARAAMTLAETYDPAILEKLGVHGVVPDLAMARGWYEKAKQFGATEATQRLELLASKER
jgi:hypothetical protein